MPTTYNGIGTRYYGRKNQQKRQGTCPHCGRNVELSSRDTRLWFVVFFLPIIPLARKRIVDECPACTRHFALDLAKWETAKQVEIAGALEKFQTSPTAGAAIETHQRLVHFHQTDQATEFQALMTAKFPDNATVHAYLGAVLTHLGRFEAASGSYRRAFELQPDLPEARIGLAKAHLRAKRLDDARALLAFLEKPGAGQQQSLAPLETLALGLQEAGRHEEALQLFGQLIVALPALTDLTVFRKNVERSEKALKRPTSLLPARTFSWKRLLSGDGTSTAQGAISGRSIAWAGVVLTLGLITAVAYNLYLARHRTLHVINALPRPATVTVRDVGQITVQAGRQQLSLPEGRHHASIAIQGGGSEEIDFEVREGFWDRWFNHPLWVLNVGGAAVLLTTTATYSSEERPPVLSFQFGHTFEFLPEITHPFEELPESLQLKAHESRTLTRLEVFPGEPVDVCQFLISKGLTSEAWRLAETQLPFRPDDAPLLHAYVASIAGQGHLDRAETFLSSGLTNRPVAIEWHRAYHGLKRERSRFAKLAADYDRQLQAEPAHSALLYLRGRVTEDRAEARGFFERAVAADPANPYPLYAQGYDHGARGDWAAARGPLEKAARLRPDEASFTHYFALARLALGERDALELECREELRRQPFAFSAAMLLCDVLVSGGQTNEAKLAVDTFEKAVLPHGEPGRNLGRFVRRRLLYELGDFAGLEKDGVADPSPSGRLAVFQAQLEQGRVDQALRTRAAGLGPDVEGDTGMFQLLVSLAWSLAGNADEARQWQDRALTALAAGDADLQQAAALLRAPAPPEGQAIDAVTLPPDAKALWIACLARQHPGRRATFTTIGRRLNVDPGFPHHLVQRAFGP